MIVSDTIPDSSRPGKASLLQQQAETGNGSYYLWNIPDIHRYVPQTYSTSLTQGEIHQDLDFERVA